jgi:hypothetical protein
MVSGEALKKLQEQIAAWPMTQRFVVQQLIEDYSNIRKDLLAYKNTGMTPEQCENAKAIIESAFSDDTSKAERIRELLKADKDGRLEVLPCKVGDTVYHISKVRTSHFEDDKIIIDDEGRWKIYEMPFALVHLPYIGKSYFLTHEEAEKALEAMK